MRYRFHALTVTSLGLLALCCGQPAAESDPTVQAAAAPAQPATAAPAIEVNSFYEDLEPYGDWVEMPEYGWSFAPRVDDDWRPYTRGQWQYTDDGWYWDSDEDFGWATYHYGRWVNDRRYGWVWVPGEEWAPAWVSWRQGNGYTGWAPLPPRARWRTNVGLQIGGLELDAYIGARDYNFVEDRHFIDRGVYQRLQPATINVTIINQTSNVTNYTTVNNRVFNRGVAIGDVERSVGRKVSQLRTVDRDRRDDRGRARAGEVAVFRPRVKMEADRKPARGRSIVKGEAPPPALVERGKRRNEGRPDGGRDRDVTARDAAQQRRDDGAAGPRRADTPTSAPVAQPRQEAPRDRGAREADAQRARAQEQQRVENERRQAEQRAREQQQGEQSRRDREQAEAARQQRKFPNQTGDRGRGTRGPDVGKPTPQPAATRPPEPPRAEPRAERQPDQRQRDQAAQEAARQQQAQEREQQRVEREKARAAEPLARERPRGREPQTDDRGKRQDNPPPSADKPKPDQKEKKTPPGQAGRERGKPKPTPSDQR